MRTCDSERGFTIVELMIASMITLMVMGVAFSTFQNALQLNEAVVQLADSNQNLRAGTNLLVRDLMQAGRNIPVGGVAIPSGSSAEAIHRPSPPGEDYAFDNAATGARLSTITTGEGMGLEVANRPTDMVTILMADPFLDDLAVHQEDADTTLPRVAATGASFDVGTSVGGLAWLAGDADSGIAPISEGDLIFFAATGSGNAIQTVTRVDDGVVYFEADDSFNFNQRGSAKCVFNDDGDITNSANCLPGSITEILPDLDIAWEEDSEAAMTVRRVLMYTYYVDEEDEAPGVPRLMRKLNHADATALAGVIEDLTLRYDLVDGDVNPTDIAELPYPADVNEAAGEVQYTPSQIRKVNVHVGVRSETISTRSGDYLRQHLSTVVSIRNLAWVSRYNTEEEES